MTGDAAVVARAFAARLEADARSADSSSDIAGGRWLRTPSLPDIWDLNVAMLGPGATDADVAAACGLELRRVTIFRAYDGPVPEGFAVERSLLMTFDGTPPPMPGSVSPMAHLQPGPGDDFPEQIAELHRRQEAAGARTFGIPGVAWAVVAGGSIDDVWVEEPERGRGYGRAVTTAGLAAGGWFLWCLEQDPRPQGLYRSLGFAEAGRVVQLTRAGRTAA